MGKFNRDANTNLMYIACDIIFAFFAFVLATIVSGKDTDIFQEGYYTIIVAFLMVYILAGKNERLYNVTTFFYADRFLKRVTKSYLIAVIVVSILLLFGEDDKLDLKFYLTFLTLCYFSLLLSAFFDHFVLKKRFVANKRTILIGRKSRYEKFVRFLEKSNTSDVIVGFVSLDEDEFEDPEYEIVEED